MEAAIDQSHLPDFLLEEFVIKSILLIDMYGSMFLATSPPCRERVTGGGLVDWTSCPELE